MSRVQIVPEGERQGYTGSIGIISKIGFLLFVFLPLIYLPNIFNPYEFPKFIFFVVLAFAVFLFNIKTIFNTLISGKIDILTKLVLVYGAVVYFADLLGMDPKTSFVGSVFRHQGFITLLAGICLFLMVRYNHYKNYILAILLGGFFVALFSLWQGIAFYIFHDLSIPNYQGRIVGTIGNPNSLAGYLVMILPFALFNKNKITKLVLSLMIVVMVIFTDSRSGLLALSILLFIYGLKLFLKLNISRIIRVFIIILVVLGFIKFADYTLHKNISTNTSPVVKERGCPEAWPTNYPLKIISDIYNSKVFNTEREALCDNRLLMLVVGLETVSRRPVLGYGQENYEIAIPAGRMHTPDNAHNIFLEIAVSSGLVGLALFIGILAVAFKKANFTVRMSLLAFLIVASFNPLSIVHISLFWFLLAISDKNST